MRTEDFLKNTLLIATTFLLNTLVASIGLAQQKIVQTDLSAVYGTGEQSNGLAPQVKLKPGVYALGDDDHKLNGTHYLIVDQYINNNDKGLALLINQDELREKSQARGRLYMIRPIQGGSTLMLSPM